MTCARWLTLLALIAPVVARAQRDETIYVDGSLSSRYLWRTRDFGGAVAEVGAGVPYSFTNPTQPQRALLGDVHTWIPLTSWDRRQADQQTRMRVQLVATSDKSVGHNWELRAGYAGYVRPWTTGLASHYASEGFGMLTAPLILERRNIPIRPYLSASHDDGRFAGTRAALGVLQEKELFKNSLQWTIEMSGSDYGRRFGYEGIALDLFGGRTPSSVRAGPTPDAVPVEYWKQYGIVLDVIVPARGLRATRAGVGVRLGAGRSPPWIR